jgi:hypothetical protein
LAQLEFKLLVSNPYALAYQDGEYEWIIVYVDDILFIARILARVAHLKKLIRQRFQLKDLDEA